MARKMSEIEEELAGWLVQLEDNGVDVHPILDALMAARFLINDLELEVRSLNHVLGMFMHDGEQFKLGVSAGRTQLKLWMEKAAAELVGQAQHVDKQIAEGGVLLHSSAYNQLIRMQTEYQSLATFLALSAAKIDDWQPIPPTETEQKLERATDLLGKFLAWWQTPSQSARPDVLLKEIRELKDFLEGK